MILSSGDFVCNTPTTTEVVIACTIPEVRTPDNKCGFYSIQRRFKKILTSGLCKKISVILFCKEEV